MEPVEPNMQRFMPDLGIEDGNPLPHPITEKGNTGLERPVSLSTFGEELVRGAGEELLQGSIK